MAPETSTATAEEAFVDTVERTRGQDASALGSALEREGQQIRERAEQAEAQEEAGTTIAERQNDTRERVGGLDKLQAQTPEEAKAVEEDLTEAARIFRSEMEGAVNQEHQGNVVAQAPLSGSRYTFDPKKFLNAKGGNGATLVNKSFVIGVDAHEEEHLKQSTAADAPGVQYQNRFWDERKVREAGALARQRQVAPESIGDTSGEYQGIAQTLHLTQTQVEMVRAGQFRRLEASLNGEEGEEETVRRARGIPEPSAN